MPVKHLYLCPTQYSLKENNVLESVRKAHFDAANSQQNLSYITCSMILITSFLEPSTHTCYFVQKLPREEGLREREENEEMRLGVVKWQQEF